MPAWSPSLAVRPLMVTRPASISRSASRREQIPCCVKNLLMRIRMLTRGTTAPHGCRHFAGLSPRLSSSGCNVAAPRAYVLPRLEAQIESCTTLKVLRIAGLVDSAASPNPAKDAINQSGDGKLRRDESFNRGNFTDVHPENSGAVC